MWVSIPSMFPIHLYPGNYIQISPIFMSCLTSIHVLIFVTHLHPGDVSDPSRSLELHLNSIHVQSQIHPDLKICVSPISRPCLICIQVSRFLHQLLQCTFSPPSRPRKMQINLIQAHIKLILVSGCVLHLRPCPASPTSRSQNSCLISIHVPAHFHPGPKDSYLTFIHVQFHFRLGNYIGISPPSIRVSHTTRTEFCVSPSPGHI